MTLKYTFLRKTKQWAVVGPPEEMRLGLVEVHRTNGEIKTETIIRLTAPFNAPEGQLQIGIIAELPRTPSTRKPKPPRFPVTVRKVEEGHSG